MATTLSASPPTVLFFGGSRGLGYHAYRHLSSQRPDFRYLLFLRSLSTFRRSREGLSLSGAEDRRTTVFEGDVCEIKDMRNALARAGKNLHAIVFSMGASSSSCRSPFSRSLIIAQASRRPVVSGME